MMKRFALLLMLLLPLVAGCLTDSGGDGDDDKNGGGSGLTATMYVPSIPGATFQYTETETWTWDDIPEVSVYTTTLSGPVTKNSKQYYMMIDTSDSWDEPDTTYIRVANNTLYIIEKFWDIASKQAPKSSLNAFKLADEVGSEIEVPFIDFDAASWNIYSGTASNEYYTTDYTYTGKYLRRESVAVPAGTFANAAAFEITMKEETTWSYNEITMTEVWETKMTMWWVAEVGLVKTSTVGKSSHDGGALEDEYTEVTVLNSYNIPN